jgi:competence protein ComEA
MGVLVALTASAAGVAAAPPEASAMEDKLDLNSATLEQLVALPGIGKAIGEAIINYRTGTGPFTSVDDLLKVPKIGAATLDKIRPFVMVRAVAAPIPAVAPLLPAATKTAKAPAAALAPDDAGDAAGASVSRDTVIAIFDRFSGEPTITEVHRRVADYASVSPDLLDSMRSRSTLSAALPELRFEAVRRLGRKEGADFSAGSPDAFAVDTNNDLWTYGWVTWHLDKLVFNPAEVPLAGKVATIARARDDLLTLATKLYFERRKLQIDLMLAPPTTVAAAIRSELKLQELTAQLDGLTGGWFSGAVAAGKRSK